MTPTQEPQTSPSGGIPEGIFIVGDVSFMYVIDPEELPVGQGVKVEDRDIDNP